MQQSSLSASQRLLDELNRPDAHTSGDAPFIVRLMHGIGEEIALQSTQPQHKKTLSSSPSFAISVLKSRRFLDLVAAHAGGDLDGWGAASALVYVTVQCLSAVLLSDPSLSCCWLFLTMVSAPQGGPKSDPVCAAASRVLSRVVALASACPPSIVAEMSSTAAAAATAPTTTTIARAATPSNTVAATPVKKSGASGGAAAALASSSSCVLVEQQQQHQQQPSHSVQTEGEIMSWFSSWEFIAGIVSACGPQACALIQRRSEEIARHKALRQSAAVMVAYLKHESRAVAGTKPTTSPNRVMLHVAKEFVEKMVSHEQKT